MNTILQTLLSHTTGLAVCWLGNNGWLIRSGDRLVATDLDLGNPLRLAPPAISAEDLAPHLDAVIVTHGHGDHFGPETARILASQSRCTYVVPANCVERAQSLGLPEDRTMVARPRQPLTAAGIAVEPQRALHGHAGFVVYRGASLDDCGYVLTLGGLRLFQPGDTVLLQDHLEDLGRVDVLFVSPTEHNMHLAPSRTLVETLRPARIFPQHFGTYRVTDANRYWTTGFPDELRASLSPELQPRCVVPQPGVIYTLAP